MQAAGAVLVGRLLEVAGGVMAVVGAVAIPVLICIGSGTVFFIAPWRLAGRTG